MIQYTMQNMTCHHIFICEWKFTEKIKFLKISVTQFKSCVFDITQEQGLREINFNKSLTTAVHMTYWYLERLPWQLLAQPILAHHVII
jgi:hypothetical protein